MIQSCSSDDNIKIPPALQPFLQNDPERGEELVSSVRAIMFYLGDLLTGDQSELIIPFEAIDSETEHIELRSEHPFKLPSSRFSLSSQHPSGRLVGSSVRGTIAPDQPGYSQELADIYRTFKRTYSEALADLMVAAGATSLPAAPNQAPSPDRDPEIGD